MERIIRVVVCDAYDLVRSGVRLLLEQDPRIRVIDEARDDDEAIEKARRLFPRVVVIDTDRPDTVRALKGLSRDLYVVILSQSDDQAQVSALLRAGADAYLLKRSSPATLIQAIEGLADRQARIPVLDPRIVARSSRLHGLARDVLSDREREILALVAAGQTSKGIACRLMLSARTVENHRARILAKLQVDNCVHAAARAVQLGLIALPSGRATSAAPAWHRPGEPSVHAVAT